MVSSKAVRIRRAGLACLLAAGVLILAFSAQSLYAAGDELPVQTAASKTVSDVPAEQLCPTCPDIYETQASGVFCPTAATNMLTSLMTGLSLGGRRRRH